MAGQDFKTYLSEIPPLKGEENLTIWDMMLRDTLHLHRRLKYIKEQVPEPEDKDSKEWEEWDRERTMVRIMLNGTIVKVIPLLELHGWNRNEQNPKVTYDIIHQAIGKISDDALPDLMRQYSTISRTNFDSYSRFVTKLQELRTKLSALGADMTEKAHMSIALNGIRDTYPDDYRFWVRDLEKGYLKLDGLMMELSNKAAKELSNGSFTQLRITPTLSSDQSSNQQIRRPRAENKTDSIGQRHQSRTQGGQRSNQPLIDGYENLKNKECPKCHLQHWKGWKQCSRCNICHIKPISDFCFLENEKEAPSWFRKLRATTPTTATSQVSGISAPVNRETTHTAIRNDNNEDLVWTASGTSLTSIQKDF
ncbi:mRNA cap guanine-N7 methyltransferase [Apiospora arundinis]